jgi:hypothetical protein
MLIPRREVLTYIGMKTRRAQHHLDALEREIDTWLDLPSYTVTFKDDPQRALKICRIKMKATSEPILMLLGDFISCLRSALDQLAWALAHLDTGRVFSSKEERQISFLIFKDKDSTYAMRRQLFPAAVADVFDDVQPYKRGDAYMDDPLWQLNELWALDKHRAIPINPSSLNVGFAMDGWENYVRELDDGIEVLFPLSYGLQSPMNLEPHISVEVLFGEGTFDIPRARLREINDFVGNDVIPKFAGFFS